MSLYTATLILFQESVQDRDLLVLDDATIESHLSPRSERQDNDDPNLDDNDPDEDNDEQENNTDPGQSKTTLLEEGSDKQPSSAANPRNLEKNTRNKRQRPRAIVEQVVDREGDTTIMTDAKIEEEFNTKLTKEDLLKKMVAEVQSAKEVPEYMLSINDMVVTMTDAPTNTKNPEECK